MKIVKNLIVIGLFLPTLSMACGSLDYWAEKYIDASKDKKTMLYRMTKCLEHYPNQAKKSKVIYEVFSDALHDDKLLESRDAQKYLRTIFYKSNCLVENNELENYKEIKQKFGRECSPSNN